MCGIAGWIALDECTLTPEQQANLAICLLKEIEVRGKDSTGVLCVPQDDSLKPRILKGAIDATQFVKEKQFAWTLGVPAHMVYLHTRQATTGDKKKNENNHPVIFKDIVLVHNGIISNQLELKKLYGGTADVDTQAINSTILAKLVGDKMIEAIVDASELIDGSMSVALWSHRERSVGYLFNNRSSSALSVGHDPARKFIMFASTTSAIFEAHEECFGCGFNDYFPGVNVTEVGKDVLRIDKTGITHRMALKDFPVKVYNTGGGYGDYDGYNWRNHNQGFQQSAISRVGRYNGTQQELVELKKLGRCAFALMNKHRSGGEPLRVLSQLRSAIDVLQRENKLAMAGSSRWYSSVPALVTGKQQPSPAYHYYAMDKKAKVRLIWKPDESSCHHSIMTRKLNWSPEIWDNYLCVIETFSELHPDLWDAKETLLSTAHHEFDDPDHVFNKALAGVE